MRKILVFILLAFALTFALEQALWLQTFEADDGGTFYSSTISLNNDVESNGQFNGLWGLALGLDTLVWTDTTSNDSLLFFPEYRIAGEWVTGDTIEWSTVVRDSGFASTGIKYVIPQTYYDSLLVWFTDPTTTANLQGYPFEFTRVKMIVVSDSNYFEIDLRSNYY